MTHDSDIVNELPYASPGDPGWKPRSAPQDAETTIEGEEIVPVVAGLAAVGSAADMAKELGAFAERRKVVLDYIGANFVKGVDFGPTDDRSDKPTLKKPGAEKLCRLFNTTPRWRRDIETWEMLGSPAGTVCYICEIVNNKTGAIIGEGRGAEEKGNKKRDANKTIKNAEKCALVDAALYVFSLSELFTQDDGGRNVHPAAQLDESKRAFKEQVGQMRQGCESSLTDVQFIVTAVQQILHKKSIQTMGELQAVTEAVIERREFDPATGERIPQEGEGL